MKYDFILTINGQRMDLISHDIVLNQRMAGRASFVVQSSETLNGLVYFSFSINGRQQHGHFYGYIERSTAASSNTQTVFCREKANLLEMPIPLALRNTKLSDVLTQVETITQCGFSLPANASYTTKVVPHFVNTGSGLHLLRNLENAFDIDDYTWLQRRDGLIYIGSWADGHWANVPVDIPAAVLDKQLSTQSAELMAIPGLRPGYLLNDKRLYSVRLQDSKMVVSWKKS